MDQRVSLITLGVADLDRSRRFYEDGLGWKVTQMVEGQVVFYQLSNGLALGLFGRADLIKDGQFDDDTGARFAGLTIAYNARDEAEVDAVMAEAKKAGAAIQKPAEKVFWGGYSGYFRDPDGHAWEVAYNPFWELDANGNLTIPQPE
ncbi:VOC family protein [Thalassospira xianhensis]|uniref:Glyoxalase n=1 Tax=Thalassospira xianhensis MCCC 1A02616 TaxID=1177929 RepID=A0A367U7R0_9PROT|nr:VOC family protein [Thalassospira xianhensis]RCK04345.1 glyoxalase [Thalassospira xianhensis MCCC 1A02616]